MPRPHRRRSLTTRVRRGQRRMGRREWLSRTSRLVDCTRSSWKMCRKLPSNPRRSRTCSIPISPLGEYLKERGVDWTYFRDAPSMRLLEEEPDHGCDLCSRYRRRAVYEIAKGLGANVIAFGHTANDFCEALLRNTMFTGRLSALPAVTTSRNRDYRLIRPLVRSEEHTSELQSLRHLVCRLLL